MPVTLEELGRTLSTVSEQLRALEERHGPLARAAKSHSTNELLSNLEKANVLINTAEKDGSASPKEIREARAIVASRLALLQPRLV